jgi:3-oxoacyl-[acyl-carrier-protein] synthase-1
MAIVVTGVGLVTSLGFGSAGSLAAIRAGLSRPEPLEDAWVSDGDDGDDPVTGLPASGYADGFFQSGAWVRLGSGAVEDLLHRAAPAAAAGGSIWAGAGLLALAPIVDEERFLWSLEVVPQALSDAYAGPLLELARVPIPAAAVRTLGVGHVGTAAALGHGLQELEARRLERLLIVAADSYVDPASVAWLSAADRLKSGERPTGLVPGEAGAALLVESEHAARARKAPVLGRIETVALAAAPLPPAPAEGEGAEEDGGAPRLPRGPELGRALAQAVRQVLPPGDGRFAGDLYLDLNGEEWRAHGWGHAQVHLARRVDFDRCRTWLPATSIGEVGAAAAPVALSLALWNFDRDGTRDALVVSTADDGKVAAVRLSAPAGAAAPPPPRPA